MRESPSRNQMKAREMFLECHRPKIVSDYLLPSDDLHFDDTITELVFNGEFVGVALHEALNEKEGLERILGIQEQHRSALLGVLEVDATDYRGKWETHLDYESIIMDKMLDLNAIPVDLLGVQSGRTFFHQQTMYRFMHQGYQLAKTEPHNPRAQWFSQWDDTWFCRHGLTRFRLIDILQQYEDSMIADFAERNPPQDASVDEVYGRMQEMHRDKMCAAQKLQKSYREYMREHPERRNYARFIGASMEYNEELRLLRSVSVFDFIHGCRNAGKHPYEEFLSVLDERQERIAHEYGGQYVNNTTTK